MCTVQGSQQQDLGAQPQVEVKSQGQEVSCGQMAVSSTSFLPTFLIPAPFHPASGPFRKVLGQL